MSTPGNLPMRAVTFWMCRCKARYKAVHHIDPAEGRHSTRVTCPNCKAVTEIEGTLLTLAQEITQGMWTPVALPLAN